MAIGYSDLKNVVRLPDPWDAEYLAKWQLRDGTTFDQIVQEIGGALLLFNRSLTTGYWAQYLQQPTTQAVLEYDSGGDSAELSGVSEYGVPDPLHGSGTGHMLPLRDYGGQLGWTYLALRRAVKGRLERDIRRAIERATNTWEKRLLERLFSNTAETVGNTGKSVPFADGGTADSDYVPPSYQGKTFSNSHNHFLRYTDDASGRSSALVAMANHLLEHGFRPPFDLIIPESDISDWTAQSEFKKPERGILATAGVETRARVEEEEYIGIVEIDRAWARVKATPRLPSNYCGMFKCNEFGNTNNPLIVRYEEGYPLGLTIVGQVQEFPLQGAVIYFTFGVGVGNRVAGTCTYFAASGNYTNPTIS